jgi:hypothetical protein
MYEVILPNGDCAECATLESAQLAVETLIDDACRYLRENLVIKRDGQLDSVATSMLSQAGMLV